jgi:hypothetical protein
VTPFHWDDVLPTDQVARLKELCRQARYRHIVYSDWGSTASVARQGSRRASGPPGTGKTMAVEVIARDLGLELYKIDLSQVVSKYIGETEKNMDRLFTDARAGNAILVSEGDWCAVRETLHLVRSQGCGSPTRVHGDVARRWHHIWRQTRHPIWHGIRHRIYGITWWITCMA